MQVLRNKSNVDAQFGPNVASQVYTIGQLLMWSSGDVVPATSAATALEGLSMEAIPSTDARYTTAGEIQYDRLKECDELIMDVTGALVSAAVPGTAYDLSDSTTVNLAATTNKLLVFLRAQGTRGVFAVARRSRATSA